MLRVDRALSLCDLDEAAGGGGCYTCPCGGRIEIDAARVASTDGGVFRCPQCSWRIAVTFDEIDRGVAAFYEERFEEAVEFYVDAYEGGEVDAATVDFNIWEALDTQSKALGGGRADHVRVLERYKRMSPCGAPRCEEFWFAPVEPEGPLDVPAPSPAAMSASPVAMAPDADESFEAGGEMPTGEKPKPEEVEDMGEVSGERVVEDSGGLEVRRAAGHGTSDVDASAAENVADDKAAIRASGGAAADPVAALLGGDGAAIVDAIVDGHGTASAVERPAQRKETVSEEVIMLRRRRRKLANKLDMVARLRERKEQGHPLNESEVIKILNKSKFETQLSSVEAKLRELDPEF